MINNLSVVALVAVVGVVGPGCSDAPLTVVMPADAGADTESVARDALDADARGAPDASPEAVSIEQPAFDPNDVLRLRGAPLTGATNGIVTIVEFGDFQDPFSRKVAPTIQQILDQDELRTKVRLVWKQLPLPFHESAYLAAQASLAVHAQGRFWPYHDLLLANQEALERTDLERYARSLGMGVDVGAFAVALDGAIYAPAVDEDIAQAEFLGLQGTPTFLVNGRIILGAQPYTVFEKAIRAEADAMTALLAAGKSLGEALAERLRTNLPP